MLLRAALAPYGSRMRTRALPLWSRVVMAVSHAANRRGIYLGRRSTRLHVALYRWSSGRIGGRLPGFPWVPIVLVDHVGARTGKPRTSPLMAHRHGGVVAVAASKAGQPTHPAWFHNLMAHPDTTIQMGSTTRPVRARVANDEERSDWWPRLVASYPGYELFQRLAGARTIPVVLLEPRAD
jgi:deazaflavin-dependent oxidoreductase (nitroreductase family)